VVVRLPEEALLERDVTLPLAAERAPQQALHYEMDRLTPFPSEAVFWNWAVIRRDKARARLHLLLFLVPKAAVAEALGLIGRAGASATLLEVATARGVRTIALAAPSAEGTRWHRRMVAAAQAACAALALTAVALPFVRQSLALQAAERRIEAVRPATEQAEAIRQRLSGAGAGADVVAAERARVGDVLQVLAAVTDLLPDDTFLTDLSMHQGKLGIAGQSAAAAKLIPVLAAEPTFRNPSFVAPVTKVENGAVDQFSIRAELAP
jgi:general secretion pathway protein L